MDQTSPVTSSVTHTHQGGRRVDERTKMPLGDG
jgi:hypothetical protein